MRPAARIEAAIEIIHTVEAGIVNQGLPADAVFSTYCRKRRYIGSKDRRAISALVYGVVRARAKLMWRLQAAQLAANGRTLVLCYLCTHEPDSMALFGGDDAHAPDALTSEEQAAVDTIFPAMSDSDAPAHIQLELPEWLEADMRTRFGPDLEPAVSALNDTAPFDMRINPIVVAHDIRSDLKKDMEDIDRLQYSPVGYRSFLKNNIQDSTLYRNGLIEVQDEAAQLACYLVDVKPGMSVVDLCAGAGGKSLLLAALMANKGKIQAFDISGKRTREFEKRAARSLCTNIISSVVPAKGEARDVVFAKLGGNADRVVVDAPCSGTGTWRRNPDQRWRLSAEQITAFAALQYHLLNEGAKMVKKSGRLIYMTCSVLEAENEGVVDAFLAARGGSWQAKPYADVWGINLPSEPVSTLSPNPDYLQLAPHKHQTDGFFVAILEKN